jgi:glyoxylase-like metal-dependent hydrolase (beta-lactamase superfamily II)
MSATIARDWYEVEPVGEGVSLIREVHVAPWLRCNIWHVRGRDRDLVIDTGMGLRPLTREVALLAGRPLTAIVTHTHFDHAGGLHQFAERCGHPAEAALIAHPTAANTCADGGFVRAETFSALPYAGFSHEHFVVRPAPLTGYLDEGDVVDLGDRMFRVLHLPGHSPGSIALWEEETGVLFSGDVVYDGALYDTIYHSDPERYRDSLMRLDELPVRVVHAGHYPSFGRDTMRAIIAEFLAGGRRIVDAEAWIEAEIAKAGGRGD